jgi:uncharacterized protein (DUF1330 family)
MPPSVSRGSRQAGREARRTMSRERRTRGKLEGAAPDITNITMIEFPSMEHARAWYNDPDYAPMKHLRQAGSRLTFLLVEGST